MKLFLGRHIIQQNTVVLMILAHRRCVTWETKEFHRTRRSDDILYRKSSKVIVIQRCSSAAAGTGARTHTTCGSSLYSRWRLDVIFLRYVVLIVWKLLHRNTTLLSPPPSFMFSGTAERLLQKARLPLSPAAHMSGTRVIKKFLPDFFKNLIGRDVLLKLW